jgi:hypothetical protein
MSKEQEARITELEADLKAMTEKFNLASAQDYCTLCGETLDGYDGGQQSSKLRPVFFLPDCKWKRDTGKGIYCTDTGCKLFDQSCSKRCDCPEPEVKKKVCEWKQVTDELLAICYYKTSCGHERELHEYKLYTCPYCGLDIKEASHDN